MNLYNFWGKENMKILCAIGLLLMGTMHTYAAEEFADGVCGQEILCLPDPCRISYLQIGGNYTHANIKVHGHSSFHGNMGGVQGSYEYRPRNSFYGGIRAAWKEGKTEGHQADRFLTYVDVQERIGYTYASSCQNWQLTLYTGFGYRFLGQRLKQGGHQSEHHSIKFDYNEFYIPVGFLTDYYFNSWCSLGLNFAWMPQVYPTVQIEPLKGARWVLKNTYNNVLVELPLTFLVTQCNRYSLSFKPFYEHWEDGRSTARTSTGNPLGLPGNVYNFWGAELNFAFSF